MFPITLTSSALGFNSNNALFRSNLSEARRDFDRYNAPSTSGFKERRSGEINSRSRFEKKRKPNERSLNIVKYQGGANYVADRSLILLSFTKRL